MSDLKIQKTVPILVKNLKNLIHKSLSILMRNHHGVKILHLVLTHQAVGTVRLEHSEDGEGEECGNVVNLYNLYLNHSLICSSL